MNEYAEVRNLVPGDEIEFIGLDKRVKLSVSRVLVFKDKVLLKTSDKKSEYFPPRSIVRRVSRAK